MDLDGAAALFRGIAERAHHVNVPSGALLLVAADNTADAVREAHILHGARSSITTQVSGNTATVTVRSPQGQGNLTDELLQQAAQAQQAQLLVNAQAAATAATEQILGLDQ